MIGGYSAVAAVLTAQFEACVDRRQVSAWYQRGTRNQAGLLPPEPVETRPRPPRTTPRYLFETGDWVAWFRPGVPGPRRKGWRVYAEREQPPASLPPQATGRPSAARQLAANIRPAGK